MEIFCDAMQEIYGATYLRAPNEEYLKMILAETASRGFPGWLGSLDCMHWGWKNYPKALAGKFKGKEKTPTIVLEAILTHSTWIWHSFFGNSGTLNNINVLQRSPLFKSNLDGTSWGVNFDLNRTSYPNGYYLVDGIYPDWGTVYKSKGLASSDPATKFFTKQQELVRKDIERMFGILKAHFQILAKPALQWHPGDLTSIMNTCIILHNMLVEHQSLPKPPPALPNSIHLIPPRSEPRSPCSKHLQSINVKSLGIHNSLTSDLIAHLWDLNGKNQITLESADESSDSSDI
jgi:hypothetical protein